MRKPNCVVASLWLSTDSIGVRPAIQEQQAAKTDTVLTVAIVNLHETLKEFAMR